MNPLIACCNTGIETYSDTMRSDLEIIEHNFYLTKFEFGLLLFEEQ